MKKKILLFSLLILAISSFASTAFTCTTPPAEVERVKDLYYFKIHGKSLPNTEQLNTDQRIGEVDYIYKNLSDGPQDVVIFITYESYLGERDHTYEGLSLPSGGQISLTKVCYGTICGTPIVCTITIGTVTYIPITIMIPPS